jgi:3-oxoacyl-[acyl-carrier protein] reductase
MQLPGFSPYGPSKAAVEAATVIWSKDLAGTPVTVNALLPGGAADTRMITDDTVFKDRSKLIPPRAMVAPLLYLASARSEGVSGRRFVASEWRHGATDDENLAAAAPAGWSDVPYPNPVRP